MLALIWVLLLEVAVRSAIWICFSDVGSTLDNQPIRMRDRSNSADSWASALQEIHPDEKLERQDTLKISKNTDGKWSMSKTQTQTGGKASACRQGAQCTHQGVVCAGIGKRVSRRICIQKQMSWSIINWKSKKNAILLLDCEFTLENLTLHYIFNWRCQFTLKDTFPCTLVHILHWTNLM